MNNLTSANFTMVGQRLKLKNQKIPSMLLIHAEWCGFCKQFLPTYKQMAAKLKNKGYTLHAIEDTYINKDLGQALNFKGYPTIKYLDANGYIVETHSGERSEKAILNKICQVYHKCV